MSFSINDLENACKEYETRFYHGQKCPGVRKMLVDVIQGGRVSLPEKRKLPKTSQHRERIQVEKMKLVERSPEQLEALMKQHLKDGQTPTKEEAEMGPEQLDVLANQYLKASKTPKKEKAKEAEEAEEAKKAKGTEKTGKAKTKAEVETHANISNYVQLIMKLNDPDRHRKEFMKRRLLHYQLFHMFGFIKNGHIRKPWSPMIWDLMVWNWVVEDFATSLVMNIGVTVHLRGGKNIDIDIMEVVKYVLEIREVISNDPFLPLMNFPMLEALEKKVFLSYIVANI